MPGSSSTILVFWLDDRRYGIALSAVERVVRMVDVTPLPRVPAPVLGVINVQSRVVPVIDLRRRFRLPERCPRPSDQLIIARTPRRTVALAVDAASDVLEYAPEGAAPTHEVVPGVACIREVVKLVDGLVLIHDIDGLLSPEDERDLEAECGST